MSAKKYAVCFHPEGEINFHQSFLDTFPLKMYSHLFERLKERVRDRYRVYGINAITFFVETGPIHLDESLIVRAVVKTKVQDFTMYFFVPLVHLACYVGGIEEIDWKEAWRLLYAEGDYRRRIAAC